MTAPRSSFLRRMLWALRRGPRRLRSAQIRRRGGGALYALNVAIGGGGVAREVVIELIRLFPDLNERSSVQAQLARTASAPPRWFQRVWQRTTLGPRR